MHDGWVLVGVVVVSLGSGGIATGVDGLFELVCVHGSGAVDHRYSGQSVEQAHDVLVFSVFDWIMRVEISDADEARW